MEQRVSRTTRAAHRLNVVVWALPAPRRVKARLSTMVYRSPPTSAERAAEVFEVLDAADVPTFCMGGWGVDALAGDQTRVHRDIDLIVDHSETAAALEVLEGMGYREWYRGSAAEAADPDDPFCERIVVRDDLMRVVDVHPLDLDGSGLHFVDGAIAGQPVRCMSAREQVDAHSGYRLRRRDRHDAQIAREALDDEAAPRASDAAYSSSRSRSLRSAR